jgi:hypothetical protein
MFAPECSGARFYENDEIIPHPKKELKKSHDGHNKEIIMMNRLYYIQNNFLKKS